MNLIKEVTMNEQGLPVTDKPTLWHCHDARSLRCLWTLAEMDIDFDVIEMMFPPRATQPGYKDMNVLGTVPYFVDGETRMTESTGICQYLVEKYQADDLRLTPDHPEYGDYLNWLFMSDATLLFPQTLVLRYGLLEKPENRIPKVVDDYTNWFWARLKRLEQHIPGRTYLVGDKFTIADIAIGYALYFGCAQHLDKGYSDEVKAYLKRIMDRPAFQKVKDVAVQLSPFKNPELMKRK